MYLGLQAVEDNDLVPSLDQRVSQVRADEACSASDQDAINHSCQSTPIGDGALAFTGGAQKALELMFRYAVAQLRPAWSESTQLSLTQPTAHRLG
jgi:hypothetical protein